jgi:hypothetical protein
VGVSPPRAEAKIAGKSTDGGTPRPSPVPADFRATMARVGERRLSRGHAERFDAIVWANEAARSGLDAATGALPEGAVLVEEAIERTPQGDQAAGLLVMIKRDGAWRFTAVGPDGEVVDDARGASCAACHRDAPRDFVF